MTHFYIFIRANETVAGVRRSDTVMDQSNGGRNTGEGIPAVHSVPYDFAIDGLTGTLVASSRAVTGLRGTEIHHAAPGTDLTQMHHHVATAVKCLQRAQCRKQICHATTQRVHGLKGFIRQ